MESIFKQAGEDVLKSTMKYLDQLQQCMNLACFEVVVPMLYGISYDDPFPCVEVTQATAETLKCIYKALSKLHISKELRNGSLDMGDVVKALGKRLGLDRIVVFYTDADRVSGGFSYYAEEQEEYGFWQHSDHEQEVSIQFRPSAGDRDMELLWPQPRKEAEYFDEEGHNTREHSS